MNYWQFKFKKEEYSFKELKDLKDGDLFFTEITENHVLKEVGINTIVFWGRTDKEKGIMLVTKINGEPYETDEVSSGKAIPMKVIKKLERPFSLEKNGFKILHKKLNTKEYKGRVRSREKIDNNTGEKLVKKILPENKEVETNLVAINEQNIKKTLKLFIDNYSKYLENGKNGDFYNIFIEANIAGQEIRHSSYLANLLSNQGKHFQTNLFLKSFINELKEYDFLNSCEAIVNFDISNYTVNTEEYHKDEEENGLMDIVLEDNNYAIIIENKTGTKDRKGQLLKYKKFAELKGLKDYIILYLTPNGDMATDDEARDDDKIISISYIDTIKSAMEKALDEISNDKLYSIIEQYIESIQLYTYDLSTDWKYELSTIELMIDNKSIFEQCHIISKLVNYNIIDKYNLFSDDEINMAKWITKYLIKSKSKLELQFMNNLSLQLYEYLEEENFHFSDSSSIFTNINNFGENIDINLTYHARQNRLGKYDDNKNESYKVNKRDSSQVLVIHKKIVTETESWMILISNDIFGLRAFYYHIKDKEIINDFNNSAVDLLDKDEFYSPTINNFLEKKYSQVKINECVDKIILGLKKNDLKIVNNCTI